MDLATLRKKVLQKLRVLARGNTATSADDTLVSEEYTYFHAEFVERDLVNWTSTADVPDYLSRHVIAILASRLADHFGVPEPRYQRIIAEALNAEGEIVRLVTPDYQPLETKVLDY